MSNYFRIPTTTLRLRIDAKRLTADGEVPLNDEERDMIPIEIRSGSDKPLHPLDEPWDEQISDDTSYITKDVRVVAFLKFCDYDGYALTINHDTTKSKGRYEDYPSSQLAPGGEVVAEHLLWLGSAAYIVRLHIQWPEYKRDAITLDHFCNKIMADKGIWDNLTDEGNEISVQIALGKEKAKDFKTYKPSQFPQQLIDDIRNDKAVSKALQLVAIETHEFYEEWHEYSDDYCDAARAYGEDCSPSYITRMRIVGEKIVYEIE